HYHRAVHEPGTVVGGRYRLVRMVGEGGMATIWEAVHQTLDSPVAVKFMHAPEGANVDHMRARFLREGRVAAAVRHRNVVEIMDFGVSEHGVPYLVMELMQGESLAERLAR